MSEPIALERFIGLPLHAPRGGGGVTVHEGSHEGSFEAGGEIPVHVDDGAVISLIVEMARARIDAASTWLRWLHFTRVFKQTLGETPGQYARSLKGREPRPGLECSNFRDKPRSNPSPDSPWQIRASFTRIRAGGEIDGQPRL